MLSVTPDWELRDVGYFISPPGGAEKPARVREHHHFWELILEGRVRHPETGMWVGQGAVFSHVAGQTTVYQAPENEHYECLTASFRLSGKESTSLDLPRHFFWEDLATLDIFAHEILYAAHHDNMEMKHLGAYVCSTLLFRLLRYQRHTEEKTMPKAVSQAVQRISADPSRPWSMEMLAAEVGLSTSHLHSEFKEATGKTPHQFITARRMAEARHRLVKTRDPVKEIAYDIGFSNTENFCRVFKKFHGQTAGAFRMHYHMLLMEP